MTSSALNAAVPFWRPGYIQVTDDNRRNPDWIFDELIAGGDASPDSQHVLSVVLRLAPADSSAFNDFRVPFGYKDFIGAGFYLYMYHFDQMMHDGVGASVEVTLVEAAPVPEPATGLLLLAGLGGIAMLRRRG